jgi:predicted nucleotide-binding protein (sugar kinase/HSP70/actin superfamily)
MATVQKERTGLPQADGIEARIRARVAEERARLETARGLERREVRHYRKPRERPFTKEQRPHTTILFGGLTWKHEHLIQGALEGLGYRCRYMPTPDVRAFQLGKEYGNNGQCNPTYFTVGNLIQYLQGLEADGATRRQIIDDYVFLTAGACGPCRFGMYEAEYRHALRNAGFDGFRVLLFQQSGGLDQAEAEAGLEMNLEFFLGILNAMNIGDVVNEVAHRIRPYEVVPGATDDALRESMDDLYEVMRSKRGWRLEGRLASILRGAPGAVERIELIGRFFDQLYGDGYMRGIRRVRDRMDRVEVDRTRVRPIVKITGEFWAQTTEGDGNFNMFRFLHGEGAELLVEPIGTWILYMLHQAKQAARDRRGLDGDGAPPPRWRLDRRAVGGLRHYRKLGLMTLAERLFTREYGKLIEGLGGIAHGLADQYEMQRAGHPWYNSRAGGGEGHLEVAKNIYYSSRDLCHMVLSLKPFGCMPSTQSDGVQAAVVSHFRDMIYLPIETSGEGEINAHSRVQMALGEAKARARTEFREALAGTGFTLEEIRAYVDRNPELKRPMYGVPKRGGVIGTAANFVLHVADRMRDGGGAR